MGQPHIADRYSYRVWWSDEDGEYVAVCTEMPSLSWLSTSDSDALAGIKKLVRAAIADMKKAGEPIPTPLASGKYSGRFNVRIAPILHRRLVEEAREENVSLNQLITMKLACTG